MNFARSIFLLFLVSFFSFSASAEDACKKFSDKVISIPLPTNGIVTDGQQPRNDLGLFFYYQYIFSENNFLIRRDENNYPILKFSFVNDAISSNSSIISINNIDLSKQTDDEIQLLNSIDVATIKTKKGSYKIFSKEYDLYPINLDYFKINAIDEIRTKEGEFKIDYIFTLSHERPDWISAGREIGNLYTCPIDDILDSGNVLSPLTYGLDYILEQVAYDSDKNFTDYWQEYFEILDKTYTLASVEGNAEIKADFDLKQFPFDKQVLKLKLSSPIPIALNKSGDYSKPFMSTFDASNNTYIELEKYKNKNYLKEWKVIDINISNTIDLDTYISKFDRKTLETNIVDTININIIVDRNTNYFIYKIIIPVFLILSIAWSVMWIPPIQVESRLTTSIVSLLALIAYNFVFNEDLPKLSYLTSLDRYILLSYLFCAIPTFLTIYFSRLTKKEYNIALSVNKKSRILGIIIYAITTTVIFSN
tara:strand:- start:638 stop:2071 length:1434 start_codon:yes stop_codon:yes gene_type:complete